MSNKTKKIIFWAVIAALLIGILIYLKFAPIGSSLMAVIICLVSLAAGGVMGYIAGKIFKFNKK